MKLDPYDVLGVPKDANASTIRKAYRRKAKSAHPDGGGSAEEFQRVNHASLILLDPTRREKYDRTGDVDEVTPDNPLANAMTVLVGFFDAVVKAHVFQDAPDPCGQDLVALAKQHCKSVISRLEKDRKALERGAEKFRQLTKRFKTKKSSTSQLSASLSAHALGFSEPMKRIDFELTKHKDALILLDGHTFDVDLTVGFSGRQTQSFFFGGLGTQT